MSLRIYTIFSNFNEFCLIAQIRWWSFYVVYTWKKVFKSYHNNIPLRLKTSKSCYAELLWAGKLSLVVVIGGCTRTSLIQQQGFLDVTQKLYVHSTIYKIVLSLCNSRTFWVVRLSLYIWLVSIYLYCGIAFFIPIYMEMNSN